MLITNKQTYQTKPSDDYKNPFRDRLDGHEYLEVHARLERYTDTYDQTQYDSNPVVGVIDVADSSGDSAVGSNMRFHGDRELGIYSETRFNSNANGDSSQFSRLSFENSGGKVIVQQAADRDGDRHEEFFRESVIDPKTGQIESVVER